MNSVTVNNTYFIHFSVIKDTLFIANRIADDIKFGYEHVRPYVFLVANIKCPKRSELVIKLAGDLQAYNVDVIMVGAMNSRYYSSKIKRGSYPISSILEGEVFLKVLVIFLYRLCFRESRQSILIMSHVFI